MSIVSKTLPGFWNGISQQPASQRLETMAELQENAMGTLVDGLYPRPNTNHLSAIGLSSIPSGSFITGLNHSAGVQFLAAFTGNWDVPAVVLRTADGAVMTTQLSSEKVRDYLFNNLVLNGHMDEKMSGYSAPYRWTAINGGAITRESRGDGYGPYYMQITGSSYPGAEQLVGGLRPGGTYRLRFRCITSYDAAIWMIRAGSDHATWLASGSLNANAAEQSVSTTFTVPSDQSSVYLGFYLNNAASTGMAMWLDEVYLYEEISYSPKSYFRAVELGDSIYVLNTLVGTMGAPLLTDLGSVAGTVQKFSDLPTSPGDGEIRMIQGNDTNNFTSYYVKWTGSVWEETKHPDQGDTRPYSTRMPHQLYVSGANTFTLAPITWTDRAVGDNTTNPVPSFFGKALNNIVLFKNRLGFLSGNRITLSKSGDLFNFYADTVLDVLDTDPIDVQVTDSTQQSLLYSSVFDKNLVAFGAKKQFEFSASGDNPLTPSTATVVPTTAYDCAIVGKPEAIGANVYFISPAQSYAIVREYFVRGSSAIADAADITAHVPRFIPHGEYQLASCSTLDMMFIHTSADPNSIYFYKFMWSGDEKPQSAWSKWTFDGEILGMQCFGTNLVLLVKRQYDISCEYLRLDGMKTGSLGFRICLDRLKQVTGTYSNGVTTFVLGYYDNTTDLSNEYMLIHPTTGVPLSGVVEGGIGALAVAGDKSGVAYWVGRNYTMRYRLSEWILKDDKNRPLLSGRLQIRKLYLDIVNTGYLRVEVTPVNRDTINETVGVESTGQLVSIANIGSVPFLSGRISVPVLAKSQGVIIDIVNDSYLPCYVQTGELMGTYWGPAQRRL